MIKLLPFILLFQVNVIADTLPERLDGMFKRIAKQEKVDATLLSSLCWVESRHTVTAIHKNDGKGDSLGICQVKYNTAKFLGFKGSKNRLWTDVETNIRYSAKYLRYQMVRYKFDSHKALAAYNAGSYVKNKNSHYVKKVLTVYRANK